MSVRHRGVSAPMVVSKNMATTSAVLPAIGNFLYLPVRDVIWPEIIDAVMMPSTSGRISRPAFVGEAPFTICRYSGMDAMPPNMPMPMMNDCDAPIENGPDRNSCNG